MRKAIRIVGLATLALSLVGVTAFSGATIVKAGEFPALGENYIEDSSFSEQPVDFTTVETKSVGHFTTCGSTWTQAPSECRSAGGAIKFTYASTAGLSTADFPSVWQDVAVKKNTYYEWSAYVKRGGDAANGWFSVGYRDPNASDKWYSPDQNLTQETTTEWTKQSLIINTGELEEIRVAMHVQCTIEKKDGWYLADDVCLKEINLEDYLDGSSTAATSVNYADKSVQYVNDPGFETQGTSGMDNSFAKKRTWRSFSWAGTDRSYWGNEGSRANAWMAFRGDGLAADEKPAIVQDLNLEKNTYYVVSFFAKIWNADPLETDLTVCFQNGNGVNSGTDNNTAALKKNLDSHTWTGLSTSFEEKTAILFTGDYEASRLCIYTHASEYNGSANGYHIDDVRVWKCLEPEAAKLAVSAGYRIGQKASSTVTVKFEGDANYYAVPFGNHVKTHFKFETPDVFRGDLQGNLVAYAQGSTKVSCDLEIMGKTIETNKLTLVVGDRNQAVSADRIATLDLALNQAISTTEYRTIVMTIMDESFGWIDETSCNLTVMAEDPKVVYIRLLTTGYHALGISKGTTSIYVTAEKDGFMVINSLPITVDTDNLLVDGGFEAQNDWNFWNYSGNGGGACDDGQTNTLRRTGYANIWTMSPIWWDTHAPYDADINISQVVTIEAGKYDLSIYMNRFYSKGVEGENSTFAGLATVYAQPLDANGNPTGTRIYREFDSSYGSYSYGKLSIVFDITEGGTFEVGFHVKGDAQHGLGMQLDDFSLTPAVYPVTVTAGLGEDVTDVSSESIYQIFVFATYENGEKVQLTTDLRYFFSDASVAVFSNGFLFPKKAGTTTCTVRAQVLDRVYSATFTIVVDGGAKQEEPEKQGCSGEILGGLAIMAASALSILGLALAKGRREE